MAWISTHWPRASRVFTSEPTLLLAGGGMQNSALERNRLSASVVRHAVRMAGVGDLSRVEAVIPETNGTLSVISSTKYGSGSALAGVRGMDTQ